jgi:protein TonB
MSVPMTLYRTFELPWTASSEFERRYRRILRNVLVIFLVLGILVPLLPVVEKHRAVREELPERVVRLIVEQPKPPPPPPRVEPKPETRVVKVEPKPVPQPVDRVQDARHKAEQSGLLALRDELADLRDNQLANTMTRDRTLTASAGDAPQVERSLITSKVGRGSGGINTAGMSRDVGSVGLAGRGTTRVQSTVGAMAAAEPATRGGSGKPSRSREEIETVFDQNKGAIYALYSRALRRDPGLQGKLVLRLTILPTGVVADCSVVSSELTDPELLQKLVERVKMFRFVAKDVAEITTTKPIDFFPA